MDRAILVINAGSSSIKFAIFICTEASKGLAVAYRGQIDGIGQHASFEVNSTRPGIQATVSLANERLAIQTHDDALWTLLDWIDEHAAHVRFVAAGHRVLHGSTAYGGPVIIDAKVIARIEELVPLAPLHQAHNLAAIKALQNIKPDLAQVACFDTAFHRTMPPVAQAFALPRALSEEGVRRYGFHGLSYEYVASVLPEYLGEAAEGRVVVAHLGHGASLCAMKGRRSIATTMTFTPLDGLPMGTRCGSIDPAVVLYLLREKGMDVSAVSDLLQHRSGLLGLSGISGDIRELLASDSPRAAEAVEQFVYWVGRELGSLVAALGGLDALVFTAGIGEHAAGIRAQVCQDAAWLGVRLDESANARHGPGISAEDSPVSAWVIPTNEELIIAQHTHALASAP